MAKDIQKLVIIYVLILSTLYVWYLVFNPFITKKEAEKIIKIETEKTVNEKITPIIKTVNDTKYITDTILKELRNER